jgi:poly(ribitol-phosphate) beta-N-acetylglucosaminyltransferase
MTTRITVVVATFNSGTAINGLLDSLDRQSLPTEQFEVVFVDDGSTDGTDERLRRLAAARPNIRTTRIPNSGWPGKPRNIGLDLAEGEYVFFADHDDFFGDEALERMYGYAHTHGSDVLIAREQKVGRRALGTAIFAANRPRVELSWSPLFSLLTPHKLFRRAFLAEHGLRFPEGRRRLEDHAFVVPAYFKADVISVLADYPCYFWVNKGEATNISTGIDPDSYYPYLSEVLDLVEANTVAGPERERLLATWYRGKVLGFIERSMRWEPERRDALLRVTGELARTRFAGSDPYLSPTRRVVSTLLRANDAEHLVPLSTALLGRTSRPVIRAARWSGAALELTVEATLGYADGAPVAFRRSGDRVLWMPPVEVGEHVSETVLDFTDALTATRATGTVRHSQLGTAYPLRGASAPSLTDQADGSLVLTFLHTLVLDPLTTAGGAPLDPGVWQIRLHTAGLGLDTIDPVPSTPPPPSPALVGGAPVVPYISKSGNLALAVDVPQTSLMVEIRLQPEDVHVTHGASGTRVIIELPEVHVVGAGERRCALHIGKLPVPGRLVADPETGTARVESWLSALPGRHRLSLALDGTVTPLKLDAVVAQDGGVTVERPRRHAATTRTSRAHRLRSVARRVPGLASVVRAVRR